MRNDTSPCGRTDSLGSGFRTNLRVVIGFLLCSACVTGAFHAQDTALSHSEPSVELADSYLEAWPGAVGVPELLVPVVTHEAVSPTPAQLAASAAWLARGRGHGPAGIGQSVIKGPSGPATTAESAAVLLAPEDFSIFKSVALAPRAGRLGLSQSTINEPSTANSGKNLFYTGNWYAARSRDGGDTWSYVSPYADMPDFCCDQDVVYDKGRDIMLWYRQGTGMPNRYLLSSSNDGGASWCTYSINNSNYGGPFGANDWFDYPHLAVSNDYLYITSNMFDAANPANFQRMILTKIPLDPLVTCSGFAFSWWSRATGYTWTPIQGATDVMYLGDHTDTDTFNICWNVESSGSLSCADRDIPAWTSTGKGSATCPVPDGNDPCQRLDQRINAGWLKEDEDQNHHHLGFFWTVKQGGSFPYPYVNAVVFDAQTLTHLSSPIIWNPDYAWFYAGAAPNARGDLGIATYLAGGGNYVQLHVGIDDDINGAPPGWEVRLLRASNDGPDADNWGDYLRVRPHSPDGVTWIVGGHTLQGGGGGASVEPRYASFGRERDRRGFNRFSGK